MPKHERVRGAHLHDIASRTHSYLHRCSSSGLVPLDTPVVQPGSYSPHGPK